MSELHFKPNLLALVSCVQEMLKLIKGGDRVSKQLFDHLFHALGTINAIRPDIVVPEPLPEPQPFPPPFIPIGEEPVPDNLEDCCTAVEECCPKVVEGKVVAEMDTETLLKLAALVAQIFRLLK